MNAEQQTADEQMTLWNGTSGRAWVDAQQLLDRLLEPFQDVLIEAIRTGGGNRVLDVGCGTGSTTLAAARLLAGKGTSVGIDISEPMLAVARTRAERESASAEFICADAQNYAFEPATVDTIISRFGVMFFADSTAAFANLRRAATQGAKLCFIAWRSAADNPFMTTAERAAAPLLSNIPPRKPDGPGQFAFADPQRVRSILEQSGWTDIDLRPLDIECRFPEPELIGYFTRFGPLGQALHHAEESTRKRLIATVRAAFDRMYSGTKFVSPAPAGWPARAHDLQRNERRGHRVSSARNPEVAMSSTASSAALVTALFNDGSGVERAYQAALARGYSQDEINLVLSEETRLRHFTVDQVPSDLAQKAAEATDEKTSAAKELGGPTGGTAATLAPAIAAAGTAALLPGLIIAGPVAIALAAAAAVGVAGGLVGVFTNWGIPKARVEQYEQSIRDGNILIGVKARSEADARELQREWAAAGGHAVET